MKHSLRKIILSTVLLFIVFITVYYIINTLELISYKNNAVGSFINNSKSLKGVSENPKIVTENSKMVSENSKIVSENSKIVSENSKKDSEKKEVYLTFDDGPTTVLTPKILDILKANKVKATFFVVGKLINEREDILKRIYSEGNAIGLHTFSHNFNKVYSNDENFIDEMNKTSDEIYNCIKIRPLAIRFPGGSYKRLDKELLKKIHKNKFKIYDWNIGIDDGVNTNISPDNLYKKAMLNKFHFHKIFLLLHCNENNINTCNALPRIIKHYKDQGYKFKIITNKTPEYYYRLKK